MTEAAQRDLDAALQLLAERTQYLTGASGVAIALCEGEEMVCRASCGPTAPEVGSELPVASGLTGESIRTGQIQRCDDVDGDPRPDQASIDRESYRALGIKSVMAIPLVRKEKVVGVFELRVDRAHAIEERDVTALERLTGMILTALELAEAAELEAKKAAMTETQENVAVVAEPAAEQNVAQSTLVGQGLPESRVAAQAGTIPEQPNPTQASSATRSLVDDVRRCERCGFPVSQGRTLCLDCEAAQDLNENSGVPSYGASGLSRAPGLFSQYVPPGREKSWLQEHLYTIGTVLIALLTVLLLWLRTR